MKKIFVTLFFFSAILGFLLQQPKQVSGQHNTEELLAYLDNGDIFTLNPESKEIVSLSTGRNYNRFEVSQDGRWIIAISWQNAENNLDVIEVATNKIQELGSASKLNSNYSYPLISPDGEKIIYHTGLRPNIHTIISSINGPILFDFPFEMQLFHWGSDNQTIYYFQSTNISEGFYNLDLSTQGVRLIYEFSKTSEQAVFPIAAYYQNSSPIFAMISQSTFSDWKEIIFLSLDGDIEPNRKAVGGCAPAFLDWSPDGKSIVYFHANPSMYEWGQGVTIYWLPETEKGEGHITHIGKPAYMNPHWSPDGSKISFATADGNYGYYSLGDKVIKVLTSDRVDEDYLGPPEGVCRHAGGGNYATSIYNSFWSPGGDWLVLSTPNIQLVDIETGSVTTFESGTNTRWVNFDPQIDSIQVTPTLVESDATSEPTASNPGNNTWIAFVGDDGNIWLIRPDGSEKKQITKDADSNRYMNLRWSPDGTQLGFLKEEGPYENYKHTLIIFDLSKGIARDFDIDIDFGFDWSADNRQIIFDRPAEVDQSDPEWYLDKKIFLKSKGLWLLDIVSNETKEFIPRTSNYPLINPDWSPDGKNVLFTESTLEDKPVHYMIADVEDPSRIVHLDNGSGCDWSPDGSQLACSERKDFDRGLKIGPCAILILSPSGQLISTLPTNQNSCDSGVKWSPDGKKLLIYSYKLKEEIASWDKTVDLLYIDTLERRTISSDLFGWIGSWSPDSSWVVMKDSILNILTGDKVPFKYQSFLAWQPRLNPESIHDLEIQSFSAFADSSGNLKPAIDLAWSQVGEDVTDCEFHFSDSLITEENWEDSSNTSLKSVCHEGINRIQVIPEYFKNDHYIAAKTYFPESGWSGISNVVHFIDSGFRTEIDGYGFPNYFDYFDSDSSDVVNPPNINVNPPDVTPALVQEMFYQDWNSICWSWTLVPGIHCDLNYVATNWMNDVNKNLKEGRCLGISATSLHNYSNKGGLAEKYGKEMLFDLKEEDITSEVRQYIARYQITQNALPYKKKINNEYKMEPNTVYDNLLSSMRGGQQFILTYQTNKKTVSHAVTPIAMEEKTDGWWRIWVYDSNPNAGKNNSLEINGEKNAWRCLFSNGAPCIAKNGETLYGDVNSYSMQTIPLSDIYGVQQFSPSIGNILNFTGSLWADGGVQVSITNSINERIGYPEDIFINEMDGAYAVPSTGDFEQPSMPVFVLPMGQTYSVLLRNLPESNDTNASLSYYGQNSIFKLSGIQLAEDARDILAIDPIHNYYSYKNRDPQEASLLLAVDEETQSVSFAFNKIDLPADGLITITKDPSAGVFIFSQSKPGSYNLEVEFSNSQGEKRFISELIEISAGSQHIYDITSWIQGRNLTLVIDENADGIIDSKNDLTNVQPSVTSRESNSAKLGIIFIGLGTLMVMIGVFGFLTYRKVHL